MQNSKPAVPWTTPFLIVHKLKLNRDRINQKLVVSFCHGAYDGVRVDVQLPFKELPARGYQQEIVKYAQKDGIYAKNLGILENIEITS